MIAIVSPAKTLDFKTKTEETHTLPRLTKQTEELIEVLKNKTPSDLRSLMSISENIAELNVGRYHSFRKKHTLSNAKQCIYAFKGDVYQGLNAENFTSEDVQFAQAHFRILSGLYGLLRPLDLIQPYRLEMGIRLKTENHGSLYGFWEDWILNLLHKDLKEQGDDILVNLASNEYFKAVDRKKIKAKVIDVEFKDLKGDQYKIIAFYAKKARGMMSHYIIKNRISNVEDLKGFDYSGYYFDDAGSTGNRLAFKRGGVGN